MKIICTCGGDVSITSESLYGRTVERCYGSCGYEGPPRPPLEELRVNGDADPDWPLCVEDGCGRKTYTPRAMRCRPCDAKRKHMPARDPNNFPLCAEHCGQRVYAMLAKRCAICAAERHQTQKLAAVARCNARVAGKPDAPPRLRPRRKEKRRPVDTRGAAIGAQRVTSEAV